MTDDERRLSGGARPSEIDGLIAGLEREAGYAAREMIDGPIPVEEHFYWRCAKALREARAAVAAERERCARVAADYRPPPGAPLTEELLYAGIRIAAAIRAEPEPPLKPKVARSMSTEPDRFEPRADDIIICVCGGQRRRDNDPMHDLCYDAFDHSSSLPSHPNTGRFVRRADTREN